MNTRNWLAGVIAGACLMAIAPSAHAAQRTFVSTSGDDANACLLMSPCRAFARAMTQTDPAGEIIVLDSGGYGAVVVDKNVSIVSPAGVYAGISVFGGEDGVLVSAPATKVVLRGLSINGQGGSYGVRVQAGEVHVENSVIANFGGVGAAGILIEGGTSVRIAGTVVRSNTEGMRVLPGAGTVSVLVRDSEFSNNATIGIRVSPSGAGNSALVTVERTSLTKSTGYGIYSGPVGGGTATVVVTQSVLSEHAIAGIASELTGATIWVRESAVTRNGTGLRQAGTSVLNACGANLLVANTTPTSGVINTGSCLDVASGSGTVTSVATGAGLTGGPITATGTINLATTNLLPTVACAANQVPQWNGSGWTCANAATGSVTSLNQGTGITLSANPITTTGSIAADTAYLQRRVSGTCAAGSSIRVINSDGTVSCQSDGPANAFVQNGNAFGAVAALGTTDNYLLELRVNGLHGLRIQPTVADSAHNFNTATPNVIGGWGVNAAYAGVIGATIGGGGGDFAGVLMFNLVTDHYGTVGGGAYNTAGDKIGTTFDRPYATVGGGLANTASGGYSTVSGGVYNIASGAESTVGGGQSSTASGIRSTVGGGYINTASGTNSTIGGGSSHLASGAYGTIGGGYDNAASGDFSTAGGRSSEARGDHSIALGRRAKAYNGGNVGHGTIVLADGNDFDFNIGTDNRFGVRATGGVYLALGIDGTGAATWTCQVSDGNAWACASDRNLKHSLVELDGRAVLAKLAAMPLYQWQPKGQNAHVRHYGPMAQDFHAAFGLGDDDKMIGMQDADGVALAAIQGVNQKLDEQLRARDEEIAKLRSSLRELKRTVEVLLAAR